MDKPIVELWYIEVAYNNKNSPCYVDMVSDMKLLQNGVFTATIKINDGNICDYAVIENSNYVDTTTPKAHQVPR